MTLAGVDVAAVAKVDGIDGQLVAFDRADDAIVANAVAPEAGKIPGQGMTS